MLCTAIHFSIIQYTSQYSVLMGEEIWGLAYISQPWFGMFCLPEVGQISYVMYRQAFNVCVCMCAVCSRGGIEVMTPFTLPSRHRYILFMSDKNSKISPTLYVEKQWTSSAKESHSPFELELLRNLQTVCDWKNYLFISNHKRVRSRPLLGRGIDQALWHSHNTNQKASDINDVNDAHQWCV